MWSSVYVATNVSLYDIRSCTETIWFQYTGVDHGFSEMGSEYRSGSLKLPPRRFVFI